MELLLGGNLLLYELVNIDEFCWLENQLDILDILESGIRVEARRGIVRREK